MAKCFVVMPVSTPEAWVERYNDGEHFKHVLDHLFTPALTSVNFKVVPPTASGSDLIHAEIIKNLEECDLVLCDISTLNPNVFFELGIRTALDRPVVIVRDNFTTRIPFDTGSINTYTYDSSLQPWILESQITGLAKHITEAAEKSDNRNSLWRYFGLTQRAAPAEIVNPTQAKLDLLIDRVGELTNLAQNARLIGQDVRIDSIYRRYPPTENPRPSDKKFDVPNRTKNLIMSNIGSTIDQADVERFHTGRGTKDIPTKYLDFARNVQRILMEVDSRADVGYDTNPDVILIQSSGVINSNQVEKINEAAKESSVKFILKAAVYE